MNFNEGYVLNSKDIEYNVDKFKNGSIKLLFITGHSGSGKSTIASKLAKDMKIDYISLDDLSENYNFTDTQLDQYCDLISSFFKTVGKKYRNEKLIKSFSNKQKIQISKEFIEYAMSKANKKYIIEGVEIYNMLYAKMINIDKFKQFAVIIKGTSSFISSYRASKRNIENSKTSNPFSMISEYFKSLSYSIKDEKQLKNMRKEIVPVQELAAVKSVGTNCGYEIDFDNLKHFSDTAKSIVYFSPEISSSALIRAYHSISPLQVPMKFTGYNFDDGATLMDCFSRSSVAIKLSTGESGNDYHLDPNMIKELVHMVNGTIVECNTAYKGSRDNTVDHMKTVREHGFDLIAPVDIMDTDGDIELPVKGTHLKKDLVGENLANYDFLMVLSHFKGHPMAGFGGALKNVAIGTASSRGKSYIHSAGKKYTGFSPETSKKDFLESMAEAFKAVQDYMGRNHMIYISVANNLSVDCDCVAHPAAPTMNNIGIFASTDPVALDQACVDFVYQVPDGTDLVKRIESRHGEIVLQHAEDIGIGNRDYRIEVI
jgi:uncharacterized protein